METNQTTKALRELAELDRNYKDIGISAVAAALKYRSDSKNPAYARREGKEPEPVSA